MSEREEDRQPAALGQQLSAELSTGLGDREDLFRVLFDLSPIGIALLDLEGRILKANQSFAEMLAYSPDELVGKSFREVTHEEDLARNQALFQELSSGKRGCFRLEKRYTRKDGTIAWGTLTASLVRSTSGEPRLAVINMVEDITERREAEIALEESRADYQRLIEMSPDPIAVHQGGEVVYVNPAAVRTLRAPGPEAIVGKPVLDFVHPDFREVAQSRVKQVLGDGETILPLIEEKFIRADGTAVDVEVASGSLTYQGRPAAQVIFRDITERKRAEEAIAEQSRALQERNEAIEAEIARRTDELRRSESKFRAVFESAAVGIVLAATTGEITEFNHAISQMLGYDEEEFERLGVKGVTHPDDFPEDMAQMRRLLAGEQESYSLEKRYRRKDGSWMWGRLTVSLIRDEAGEPELALGVVVDVTERKEREEALEEQMARMTEIDRLKTDFVSTVSHELRTPLTSIMGYTEFLEDQVAGELTDEQRAFVDQIREGGVRLRRLVDDLLDFARLEAGTLKLQKQPTDLVARLRETAHSLEPQIRASGLTLALALPEAPLVLPLDGHRFDQVMLNLLGNAIKFTPAGGTISVTACRSDGQVRVEVADTGIGIAEANMERLFERFYQVETGLTRERGGAGLGLAISKAIVEAHGGAIGAESTPGRGSTFWFTLPVGP
ncbi:MAG: PAS domain S-box protein [Candidatus Sericytochromatia bacterium]